MTLEPVKPEDLAWGEVDGAVSINAEAVARRLNELLEIVQRLERYAGKCEAYGWDAGKARAFEALLPYVHHIGNCGAIDSDDPRDDRCLCGLRSVWRIRETPEPQP